MKRLRLYLVAALVALVALPAIASAHWVGRMVKANAQWWAIHYDLNPGARGVEFFASYGGVLATPYRVDVYNPYTGTSRCGTGWIGWIQPGEHATMYCPTPFAFGDRCRIRSETVEWGTPGIPADVGYYCRELY